ncbi:hypothetical protein D3C77_426760 [compost metagenome]
MALLAASTRVSPVAAAAVEAYLAASTRVSPVAAAVEAYLAGSTSSLLAAVGSAAECWCARLGVEAAADCSLVVHLAASTRVSLVAAAAVEAYLAGSTPVALLAAPVVVRSASALG